MLLHPHQKEIVESKARFKIIRGGRRGGKTMLETEIMAYKACSKAGRRIFYIAPTQTQAREIIWQSLHNRLSSIGKFNEQRLEVTLPTLDKGTSVIKVAGWENRENFRGKPADHITFDETDTMRDFFIGWQEIFLPTLIDTSGSTDFIGTPKKENPNLRRLEKESENDPDWQAFHFTSWSNPSLPKHELEKMKEHMDATTYKQEIMAEYVENAGALFRYTSLIDMFSNTIEKKADKYMTVDVADDGSDKTVFCFWQGLEAYRFERFAELQTDGIISQIREYAAQERIPYSHIAVDAIGVGAGVASAPLLKGVVGFKSSYAPIRVEHDIVRLPNVHYLKSPPLVSEYRNLRSQCIFTLAQRVNDHEIAVRTGDTRLRTQIIEELATYQDVSQGDGKTMATQKDDVKEIIGRSPDISDTLIMRCYFELKEQVMPSSEEDSISANRIRIHLDSNESKQGMNSTM